MTKYDLAFKLIKLFEGCKYKAYQDTAGIWTIGIGHTKDVHPETVATDSDVQRWFIDDCHDSDLRIASLVKIHLEDYEYASLLSLGFNLSYKSYTVLVNYLNSDKELFKDKMLQYCRDAKGNYLKGLVIRRMAERLLFENREYESLVPGLQRMAINDILGQQEKLFT